MNEYNINLDVYNGPMDLLLYLIRREEVDIYDIPISRIADQYMQYVEMIKTLDPNLAGEFVVLAATLIEIKARMLIPAPPTVDGKPADASLDPRADLVRQLLEYKAFKDAAGDLAKAGDLQSMKFPRRPVDVGPAEPEVEMEDIQVWDLFDAFSRLMASIGKNLSQHEVIYDDTPIEMHAEDIMDRLSRDGTMMFSKIFEGRTNRSEIVGLFLAILQLVYQRKILAAQDDNFQDIRIEVNPEPSDQGGISAIDQVGRDTHEHADDSSLASSEPEPQQLELPVSDAPSAAADQADQELADDFDIDEEMKRLNKKKDRPEGA